MMLLPTAHYPVWRKKLRKTTYGAMTSSMLCETLQVSQTVTDQQHGNLKKSEIYQSENPGGQLVLTGKCDCGAVTVRVPKLPQTINACPCDYCSRVGARWGYLPTGSATIEGTTVTYRRGSKTIEFHRCRECGVITHWIDPTGFIRHMGVHMINFDQDILSDIPVVVDP